MVNPKLFSISAAVLTAYVQLLSDNPFGLKVGHQGEGDEPYSIHGTGIYIYILPTFTIKINQM